MDCVGFSFPLPTGRSSSTQVPPAQLCSLGFHVPALLQPTLCDLVPVACTLWAASRGSLSVLPARDPASLAAETLPHSSGLRGRGWGWALATARPPTLPPQPRVGGRIRAWFWTQPRRPLPRAHLPAPRPLPDALGEPGPRGSSSRSRIWGAAPARGEAWGARGPGPGPGPRRRTYERTGTAAAAQRSGGAGRRRPRRPAQTLVPPSPPGAGWPELGLSGRWRAPVPCHFPPVSDCVPGGMCVPAFGPVPAPEVTPAGSRLVPIIPLRIAPSLLRCLTPTTFLHLTLLPPPEAAHG
ncbi:translation initiation factor IF-2-like [Mustela erminea]|uniref:translation initiation factor IF-2-like n=1 Tax=Mustela erminea TaxID=36723 RepID=UPI0013869D23|nr:translation initiation factor IF-2-like [Mustela erminea]